jgi:galactose mutarotase-like enzyme
MSADRSGGAEPRGVVVEGGGLTVAVSLDRGAKIVSLRDSSREWLAQAAPHMPTPPPGTAFVDAEMSGWDECAPSIVACTVDGWRVPDHGSLWDASFGLSGVTATVQSDRFSFSRSVEALSDGVLLSYRAWTDHDELPFLWAAHPQFVAPQGTSVRLPDSVANVVDVLGDQPVVQEWGLGLASIDSVEPGGCRKFYADPSVTVNSAALVHPDGSELLLEWSDVAPFVGVWFDRCAFSREPVIAIEPTTGYYDSLRTARDIGRVTHLRAGNPLEWSVKVRTSRAGGV